MDRVLSIMEVSQKQAYIFGSNKLKDNVKNSNTIAWVTSREFLSKAAAGIGLFDPNSNYVYAGGGHTVLEFADREKAKAFNKFITKKIHIEFPDIELFVAVSDFDNSLTNSENLEKLTSVLEKKKATRYASFHQGSFGVESIDADTLTPKFFPDSAAKQRNDRDVEEEGVRIDESRVPAGYEQPASFDRLGGSKNEKNFVAVVHIDGNAMGKRVMKFYKNHDKEPWEKFKADIRNFSEAIEKDFSTAYRKMINLVIKRINDGTLDGLDLRPSEEDSKGFIPVRRLITSGDDVCFVTDGRIGIECAVNFIKEITRIKNPVDHKKYAACAGVAIVHQKYPFFKAYELAEALCSNAKKFGADIYPNNPDKGSGISAIDWHVEMGEIRNSLEETKKSFETKDGKRLEMRPYIISGEENALKKEPYRQYRNFKKMINHIDRSPEESVRGRLKDMRQNLYEGKESSACYIKFHKMEDICRHCVEAFKGEPKIKVGGYEPFDGNIFLETRDGCSRSVLFDGIEIMDEFIDLNREEA